MSMTQETSRGTTPAASTIGMPGMDAALHLSARTLAWLADHPPARKFAYSVWDKLTELERGGHRSGTIHALRQVLADHGPTASGRCRACRRRKWRRRRFPCIVWHEIAALPGMIPRPQPLLRLPPRRP
ncbi:MAG: hypothetical protein ACRDSM_08700 [Pseudonocardiaceae bacterium]